jgi:hypothetical protein
MKKSESGVTFGLWRQLRPELGITGPGDRCPRSHFGRCSRMSPGSGRNYPDAVAFWSSSDLK